MNCDQAFDCLTDWRRRDSDDLLQHLAGCPRCRRMRETLEPALDLLGEVVDEPDVSGYCRTRSRVAVTDAVQIARETAARFSSRGRRGKSHRTAFAALRYAAAILIGAGVVLALHSANQSPHGAGSAIAGCAWAERELAGGSTGQELTLACMSCHFTHRDVESALWTGGTVHGLPSNHAARDLNCVACHVPASMGH